MRAFSLCKYQIEDTGYHLMMRSGKIDELQLNEEKVRLTCSK
jgi:hypothetical protein